jgi:hypothetical protein
MQALQCQNNSSTERFILSRRRSQDDVDNKHVVTSPHCPEDGTFIDYNHLYSADQ